MRLAALAIVSLLPATAAAERPEFREVAHTTNIRFYAPHGAPKVDARRSQEFVERLFSLFGTPRTGWQIDYYRHTSSHEMSARMGFAASGVTDLARERIDSTRHYHPHELVHAVAGRLGQPPLFFAEGLAVALGSEGSGPLRKAERVAGEARSRSAGIRGLITSFGTGDPHLEYALAGAFVGFLLDRYGIDAFADFLRACRVPSRWESAIASAYHRDLADLEHEWRSAGPIRPSEWGWLDERTWPGSLRTPEALAALASPPLTLRARASEGAADDGLPENTTFADRSARDLRLASAR